jgi:hypothetical protein
MAEQETPRVSDAQTADELRRVEAEPLLPAEKWLIFGSLLLGLALLGILLWLSNELAPVK